MWTAILILNKDKFNIHDISKHLFEIKTLFINLSHSVRNSFLVSSPPPPVSCSCDANAHIKSIFDIASDDPE